MTDSNVAVIVLPLGISFGCRADETIMAAARRAGFKWPTICNGSARCGVCYLRVVTSAAPLPAAADDERRTLKLVPAHLRSTDIRLACRLSPAGDIIVERQGIQPTDRS